MVPPIIILIGILLTVGVVTVVYKNKSANQQVTKNTQESTSSVNPQQAITPSPKPTKSSTPTSKTTTPAPKPSSTATPAPTTTSTSNPYDLTSATGSVKVMVKAQNGNLGYTPSAELSTVSGFKVLDGRSTDKITQFGKDRTDELRGEIVFSTAPPGPYKVRISYNGSWSDQKDISVSSAKQSGIEFMVAGVTPTPAPTPTPTPKSTCQVNVASKSSDSAPSTITLAAGAPYIYKPANLADKYITAVQWDYDGDGNWDTEMSSSNQGLIQRTYQSQGTHTVKAKIQLSDGEVTDICNNSFTLQ